MRIRITLPFFSCRLFKCGDLTRFLGITQTENFWELLGITQTETVRNIADLMQL